MPEQKIIVNAGGFDFEFEKDKIAKFEIVNNKDENFSFLYENQNIKGNIISADNKKYIIELDGERFPVQIKNELDQVLDQMGLNKPKTTKINAIKAPMPGLVIEICVTEGQEIIENDKVLILEAMKMENVIKIPHEAVVKKILVKTGQAVEKGQTLIELA
ncbi:acetyl-CoA carboxylase biotin carboxyl carrier protein subunit [Lacihabitans sp. LS3-19]|uniref:acetyl-CoA carboxylase biotin carboxyl carrier protein subunit n=1 Tax=Lacihabitans sp. LS3-19 TaxID=2487335 RepID=UPI0020CD283B|nr:acetyl-CoA carboxylase biotin carboxyl carrier protein subunit [Lacihabitans sp. LS3-19]MCP9768018.1 acetyl-CoA carboxylase biotin carboxyl carrier protein subunit [Lacihabitans sp. LS3-19]